MRVRRWSVALIAALVLAACEVAPPPQPITAVRQTATPAPTATLISAATLAPPPTATRIGTATPTATSSPTATSTPTAAAATAGLAGQMLEALNLRRREGNCPTVAIEERLQQAAQAHADEIARRREVSHRSADGSELEQRLQRVGYSFLRRSETIAVSADPSALAIVDLWLDEPIDGPHRSSVMNCFYQHVGIGVAETEAGMLYWVVDYAQPSE